MIEIPGAILTQLKKLKGEEAILFTGSRALGKAEKNSDWDFYVLLNEGKPSWRQTKKVGDTWVEVFCADRKQIQKTFYDNVKEGGRGVDIYMFATGVIVKDNGRRDLQMLVSKAKKLWNKGPKKLSKNDLNFISYDIASYLQDVEDCLYSNNQALLLFDYAVNEMVNYAFKLHGVWVPRPKDRLGELKKLDASFFKLVNKYLQENNWREKGNLILVMGLSFKKKFGLSLDGELYLAPKQAL